MKRKTKRLMLRLVDNVETATQLAECAAWEMGEPEWLDDETHWVWEMAVEFFGT